MMPAIDRATLRQHLVEARIAGVVDTPRENSLRKYAGLARREDEFRFGVTAARAWSAEEILDLMGRRCGVDLDPTYLSGPDQIDPDLTIDGLEAVGRELERAAATRATVLLATGHPAGLLAIYSVLGRALAEKGCTLLTPGLGWAGSIGFDGILEPAEIRYLEGVAVLSDRGHLLHCHSPAPMLAMLDDLRRAGVRPDLVIADHGLAGAAGVAGLKVVAFADCNDPGLFLAAEEGVVDVCVPIDDNVLPHLYAPVTSYLLQGLGAAANV